jgi:hypothetical protein
MLSASTDTGKPVRVNLHPVAQLLLGAALALLSGTGVWMTNTLIRLENRTTALEVMSTVHSQSEYVSVREFAALVNAQELALGRLEAKIDQLQGILMDPVARED